MKSAVTLTPKNLAVGQEVQVSDGRNNLRCPIIKVGRALVTIEMHGRPHQFRIDTQRLNREDHGVGTWFRTDEQVEQAELVNRARSTLFDARLRPDRGADPEVVIRVAEFLRNEGLA